MARPREFDPDVALHRAIELFWERGYFDTSVDEIVRRTGVAKYGIYGTFGGKRELFLRALHQYELDRHRDIQAPIRRPDASLPEIREFFSRAIPMMTQKTARRGCLVTNTGVELGARDPEIQAFVARFFKDLTKAIRAAVKRAVDEGALRASTDTDAVAAYLTTEFRAALMLAASGHSRSEIARHVEFSLNVLN